MVETSNIMIGNLILDYNNNLVTVDSIGKVIMVIENKHRYMPVALNGIPLDSTILTICFGFAYAWYEIPGEVIPLKNGCIYLCKKSVGFFVYNEDKFLCHIHFVHQFQNIAPFLFDTKIEIENLKVNLEICLKKLY